MFTSGTDNARKLLLLGVVTCSFSYIYIYIYGGGKIEK